MSSTNVGETIKSLFSKMDDFVSTKTVVGEAVHIGDVILVPLVDVTFGMGTGIAGSADTKTEGHGNSDAGGGAVGAKMTPAAVIVIMNGTVQLVNVKNQETFGKMIDMIPGLLTKLNLGSLFGKKKEDDTPDVEIHNTEINILAEEVEDGV